MDESASGRILGKIGLAILAIALADLVFLNWWTLKNDKLVTGVVTALNSRQDKGDDKSPADSGQAQAVEPEPSPTSLPTPQKEKTSTVSDTLKTSTVVQNAQKEIFISLGSGSTKSNDWAELAGLQGTIDFSKYSGIDSMVFSGSVWVDGGNGRAWGELYNSDDKTLLIESRISSPTGTATLMTSGHVPIAGGAKTYKVYAKTDLTDYAAHVDNARIKITLK